MHACLIGILARELSTVTLSMRIFPIFSFIRFRFSIYGFMCRSLFNLDLIFCSIMNMDIIGYSHRYTSRKITNICSRCIYFVFHSVILASFSKNHLSIGMWVCIWVFHLILLTNLSVLMSIKCVF